MICAGLLTLFFTFLLTIHTFGATFYVRGTGGSDSNDGSSHAQGFATFSKGITSCNAADCTVLVQCGQTFRYTTTVNTDVAGSSATPNTATSYNDADGATCSARPRLTHSTRLGGVNGTPAWTVCTSGCPITSSIVYKATSSETIREWGMLLDSARFDLTNGQWGMESRIDDGQGTCPSILTSGVGFDRAWCQSGTTVYLRSDTGDPDIRFNDIEIVTTASGSNQLFSINHDWWILDNIELYMPKAAALDIEASNITLRNFISRHAPRGSFRTLRIYANQAAETLSNILLEDCEIHDCGRDCGDLSGPGRITGVTIRRCEVYNAFDHPSWNLAHDAKDPGCVGADCNSPGPRDNIIFEDYSEHDTCDGLTTPPTPNPADGSLTQFTMRRSRSYDMVGQGDIRCEPTEHDGSGTGCACATTSTGVRTLALRGNTNATIENSDIRGGAWGVYSGKAVNIVTIRDSTITGASRGGVVAAVNGGTISLARSVVAHNCSGAASNSCFQVGCNGNFPNVIFGTGGNTTDDENYYWQPSAVSNQFARCNSTSYDMAGWRARTNTTGDDQSVHTDPLLVNVAGDRNPQSGSPLRSCSTTTPIIGAGRECGGYEQPEITGRATVDANTLRWTVNATVTPVVLDTTKIRACIDVGASDCTTLNDLPLTSCTVEAGGNTFTCDFGGAGFQAGNVIKDAIDYAGVQSGCLMGAPSDCFRGSMQAVSGTVTNTLTNGPTPVACAVQSTDPDAVTIQWTGEFLPANCTGFSCTRNGTTWTQSDCDPVNTNNTYIDNATDALAGETVACSYDPATGNATVDLVEPSAFTLTCINNILPAGTVVYVNQATGDDVANDCTEAQNPATPKATITGVSGGISCLPAGGSTLQIASGTYAESITSVPNGASYTNPTLIRAASGATAVIQPTGANFGILVSGTSKANAFHIYQGLILDQTNASVSALRVEASATHVRFRDGIIRNVINGNGVSIEKPGGTVEILNTEIHDIEQYGIQTSGSNSLFEQLNIHDIGNIGVRMLSASGGVNSNTLSKSRITAATSYGVLVASGMGNRVVNNVIYTNGADGIRVETSATGSIVEQNSITLNFTGLLNLGVSSILRNNISFGNSTAQITDSGTSTTTATNLTTDPGWVNAAAGDLHLSSSASAAYNTGTTVATVTDDFDSIPRPLDGLYDIGAFEFDTPPDTVPPVVSNGLPAGTLAAGTTSVLLQVTTNEAATCKHGTVAGTAFASIANTFTSTGGTLHTATIGSLTDGVTYTRYIRCQDVAGNANLSDFVVSWSIAFPDPVVTTCIVQNATPDLVECLIAAFGSVPITPANNCTGWTCTKNGGAWTVDDCDRTVAGDGIVLNQANNLVNGDTATCTYTRGTGSPILNAAGQELVAGTFSVTNNVDVPAPPTEGTITQTHARFCQAGLAGDCPAGLLDARLDTNINLPVGGAARVAFELACGGGNNCSSTNYVIQACDNNINCGEGQGGRYDLATGDFNGRLARFVDDPAISNGATVTASLSGCTVVGGRVYEDVNTGLTIPLTDGECGTLVAVFQLSPSAGAGNVRFYVRSPLVTATHSVVPIVTAITGYASR